MARWIVAGEACYKITGTRDGGETIVSVLERGGDDGRFIGREFTWTRPEIRVGIESGTLRLADAPPPPPAIAAPQGSFPTETGKKRTKKGTPR